MISFKYVLNLWIFLFLIYEWEILFIKINAIKFSLPEDIFFL